MAQNPQRPTKPRGPESAIPLALWTELQRRKRAKQTLAEIARWLKAEHAITVSLATISRKLSEIQEAAPEPDASAPPLNLEPATDEDELAQMRRQFRSEMREGDSARDRQGAARLVLAIMAEQRERKKPQAGAPAEGGQPEPAAPTVVRAPVMN